MRNQIESRKSGSPATATGDVISMLLGLDQRLTTIEQVVTDMHNLLQNQSAEKEWYSTAELAEAMQVSQYTVQERWSLPGRITAEKDPDTGKWRIPGREYHRLVRGGSLKSNRK